MAVVLPIHSHVGFSNPMDNDYDSRCQKEETEDENESSSRMFTNREIKGENDCSVNDSRPSSFPEEKVDGDDESNNSMDTGESCDDCDEKAETLPLNLLPGLNETEDSNTSTFDCNPNREEETTRNNSADNYWLMENEIPSENKNESGDSEDENSAFVSSLMAVDLDSHNANNETTDEPIADPLSNIAEAELVDEAIDKQDDDTNFELEGAQTAEATPTVENNNVEFDEAPIVDAFSPTEIMTEIVPDVPSYGGLNNLGNTCYMASAIQLLCGLDSFPEDLKSRIPPENNSDTNDNDSKSQSLRDALIDVMDRLEKGETVRPDDLKTCIDSRTSLFLGYRQQDSHEFLTTLLDIIDEDYKIKNKPEETKTVEATENLSNGDGDDETDLAGGTNEEQVPSSDENETIEQECDDDENDCHCDDDSCDRMSLESALKKQKVVEEEPLIESEMNSIAVDEIESVSQVTDVDSIRKSKSYSDFKFSDIESLLHDKEDSSAVEATETLSSVQTKATSKQDEPKCKLAGGRMSTAGVELTRFVEDCGAIDEDVRPTGVSLENATPQQQIVESDDHEMEKEEETEETSLSPVSSNFTTKVRVCLTCESCKFRRSHIETYLHLSLDISTGSSECDDDHDDEVRNLGCPSSSSIEDGLRRFFAPEKREIKCEKCFHTSALQTSEITQLPRNLLFHLKRFIVDVSPDYSSISYRKDQSSVIFDERMELEAGDESENENNHSTLFRSVHDDEERGFKDFLAADCSYEPGAAYEIRSVVNHIGSSASCGHYTADAKRKILGRLENGEDDASREEEKEEEKEEEEEPISEDREWFRFNDSYVSRISSKEAVEDSSKTAYMIMYELVQ